MSDHIWDHECDVLVVGSGAGGLTAAAVAADHHAETLVVEKGARFGGTSATSGGVLWIPVSHLAQAAGAKDSIEEAFTRSEEHTSELQSLMRISYAVFCLKKKKKTTN